MEKKRRGNRVVCREKTDLTADLRMRAREEAVYLIEHGATVRAAAKHFGVSKSTVHKDVTERLAGSPADASLREAAAAVLRENKAERHIRGGEATREKYRRATKKPGDPSGCRK